MFSDLECGLIALTSLIVGIAIGQMLRLNIRLERPWRKKE